MAKILIVDDSSFQRRMIRGLLLRMGHEVSEADSGATGLAAVETEAPDVLLVDLLMPDLTGYQVLERLRDAGASFPRIVLTADVQHSAEELCLSLGALRVLHKPPNEKDLKAALELALDPAEANK